MTERKWSFIGFRGWTALCTRIAMLQKMQQHAHAERARLVDPVTHALHQASYAYNRLLMFVTFHDSTLNTANLCPAISVGGLFYLFTVMFTFVVDIKSYG